MNIKACISNVIDTTAKIAFTDNNTQFNAPSIQFILDPSPANKIAGPFAAGLTGGKGTATAEPVKNLKQ